MGNGSKKHKPAGGRTTQGLLSESRQEEMEASLGSSSGVEREGQLCKVCSGLA